MDIGSHIYSPAPPQKKNIYFYKGIPSRTKIPDWLTIHRSFCKIWPVNLSNVLIYVCGKSIPYTYHIFFGYPIKR